MGYDLPDELIDELNYGNTASFLKEAVPKINFKDVPQFKDVDLDEIESYIKGYIAYCYLSKEDELSQHIFIRLITGKLNTFLLVTFINEFIKVFINSKTTDNEITDSVKLSRDRYTNLIKYCKSKSFAKLSKKYDEVYYNEANSAILKGNLEITPKQLVTLMKCAIIEEKEDKESEFNKSGIIGDYNSLADIINAVYYIYCQCALSFDDRKAVVEDDVDVLDEVLSIVDANGLSR